MKKLTEIEINWLIEILAMEHRELRSMQCGRMVDSQLYNEIEEERNILKSAKAKLTNMLSECKEKN